MTEVKATVIEEYLMTAMWDAIIDTVEKRGYVVGGGSKVITDEGVRLVEFGFVCQQSAEFAEKSSKST